MNILFVTATYAPSTNGVALSTARIAEELQRLGHTIGIVGPQTDHMPNDILYFPFPVIKNFPFLPRDYPLPIPFLTWQKRKAIKAIPWNIVHVQHPSAMIHVARSLGSPVVFTYHTQYDAYIDHHGWWLPASVRKFLYTKSVLEPIQKTDGIIVLVRWFTGRIERHVRPVPVYYVPTTGIPPFFFQESHTIPRRATSLSRPLFLAVSRLSKEKNLGFLLSVIKHWRQTHKKGELVIIGDGRKKKALQKQTQTLGIASHVRFLGNVSDQELATWHRSSDLLLFTSVTETSPMTILEAMAGGLPAVTVDCEATREIVVHGKNGMLVQNSPADFILTMERALKKRTRLSKGAQMTARLHTLSRSAKKLLIVYEKIISDCQA